MTAAAKIDFRPLNETERGHLADALIANYRRDLAILMDQKDTSFAGTTEEDLDEGEQVINAIRSVPVHYSPANPVGNRPAAVVTTAPLRPKNAIGMRACPTCGAAVGERC